MTWTFGRSSSIFKAGPAAQQRPLHDMAQGQTPPAMIEQAAPATPAAPSTAGTGHDPDTHRHYGHPDDHPVGLRHRKASQDPLHGQEDKLYDELKELRDGAGRGELSPMQMTRLREVQGQLQAIQHQRMQEAQQLASPASQVDNDVAPSAPMTGGAGTPATSAVMNNGYAGHPAKPATPAEPIKPFSPAREPVAREQPRGQYLHHPETADRPPSPVTRYSPGGDTFKLPEQKALTPEELTKEANEMGAPATVPTAVHHDPAAHHPKPPKPISL